MTIKATQTPTKPQLVTTKPLDSFMFSYETFLAQEGSPLILIADDDELMRTMLALVMEKEGYRVIEACNGEQCLAAYKVFRPDLVLLDAVMPGMDGFTCCRELRAIANRQGTTILMITSLDDSESIQQAFTAGAMDYITKPIPWTLLRRRVRHLLQGSKLFQQFQQLNTELKRRGAGSPTQFV
jgi:PleD family two-component response regulator